MSSFDEEFRRQSAAASGRSFQQALELDRLRRAAAASLPAIIGLLREFVERVSAEGVTPRQVMVGGQWSPPGYILHEDFHTYGPQVHLLTVDERLFTYTSSGDRKQLSALDVECVANGRLNALTGPLTTSDDGRLVVRTGEYGEQYETVETQLAQKLAQQAHVLIRELQVPPSHSVRREPRTASRLEAKIEKLRAKIKSVEDERDAYSARCYADGVPESPLAIHKIVRRAAPYHYKLKKLEEKNRDRR